MTASADILAAGEICGIHFKNNEEGWCHVVDEDDHGDRTLNRVSYKNGFSLLSHASLSFLVPNLQNFGVASGGHAAPAILEPMNPHLHPSSSEFFSS